MHLGFPAHCAVFQAGWAGVPAEWRQSSDADAAMWRAVLGIRSEINLLLEKARADKALGASLEAKVRPRVWLRDTRQQCLGDLHGQGPS